MEKESTATEPTERPVERQILYAKGRLSLAKMYIKDLENGIVSIPKGQWIGFIEKILAECEPIIPVETAAMSERAAPFITRKAPVAPPESVAPPTDGAPANVFRGQVVEN